MKKYLFCLAAALLLAAFLAPCPCAAAGDDAETKSEVQALNDFHIIIYQIWHKYYPEKDYENLKKALPEIKTRAALVYKAQLPGILRDRKKAWDAQVENLKECVKKYGEAASGNDNEKLLAAAESLHSQYEKMARVIKPTIKEVDDFHVVLYNIYHKYIPDYNYKALQKAVPELAEKKDLLMKASLPKPRRESSTYPARVKSFETAREGLSKAVDGLSEAIKTGDKKKITEAVENVHKEYLKVQQVFE
ncbi:MAG: hypothetical protein RDV48_01435 [Candidatus Eremiobacteraeota bacterium]|nr:hypothetical protein [Candidatus Eremiobacteraeota bacterium]